MTMSKLCLALVLLGPILLSFPAPAVGQLLPFAWDARPKVLFRYGRGNWAFTNFQRYYDPDKKEFFWGWPGDFYGIGYDQPPLIKSVPPVILLDIASGVGWERRAHILVRVPLKDARVSFNEWQTPQQGHERSFDSPPLERGVPVTYQVTARWSAPGGEIMRTRTVTLAAGEEVVVDFNIEPTEP